MKSILFSLVILATPSVFAISDQALTKACWAAGVDKIESKANGAGCEVNLWRMQVSEIDNRWYSPSKYIWYSVAAKCPNGNTEVSALVQYSFGKCY